jgi:predicted RNA-binding Zn ribbon-like protein
VTEAPQVERFSRIGGHPAVDLVNTVDWRLDTERRSERLSSFGDVLAWGAEMGLLADDELGSLHEMARRHPRASADEWRDVLRLREHAYQALIDTDVTAAAAIAATYQEWIGQARLTYDTDGSWSWKEPQLTLRTPRHRIARAVVELLTDPMVARLHQCEDDACGWVFLDTSPRGNRRWCVSADCGNRNRVRRHYERRRGGA